MATSKPPAAGTVRVKVMPKDPLVARRDDLWPVQIDLKCASPGSGPTGPHAVVVDYNADLDTRFAPAVLQKNRSFKSIATLSNGKLLDNFQFHQVNVWAIVEQTLEMIENPYLMGRPIPWASQAGRLILLPHAGYQENAFYDRATGALHFFYFEGPDGQPVYTCLSHDIITHELGHAVLDGLKPYFNEVSSPETAGFHEYFGDAVAMMASLGNRETTKIVTKGGPDKLEPKNVVSAIASEFGAAIRRMPKEDYLRGAWNQVRMRDLCNKFEEHDWSEVLTGVYYDLLAWLYPKIRSEIEQEDTSGKANQVNMREYFAMRALNRAATTTAGVMFRALDYCPPVDLRYAEYARAVLRADEVAYPVDHIDVRAELNRIFDDRGICPTPSDMKSIREIQLALRGIDIGQVASTPADAYRFLDCHRKMFGIPYDANFSVPSVYRTNKQARSGYRPPKEHVIEFVWTEGERLDGPSFGSLSGTVMPLLCGGTVVFDGNGNFLHLALVAPTETRRTELKAYVAYLVRTGSLAVADGLKGLGAPSTRVLARVEAGHVSMLRNAAMRHAHPREKS